MKFLPEWPRQRVPSVPRGLLLALVQINMLMLIGFSFWMDRMTQPRVWVQTEPVDPNLPIRGRYISLRLVVPVEEMSRTLPPLAHGSSTTVRLKALGNRLVAFEGEGAGVRNAGLLRSEAGVKVVALQESLAFFLPPDVEDPSNRGADDPLWVEVTLPRSGAPRPIRLGEEREGRIEPLGLRLGQGNQDLS